MEIKSLLGNLMRKRGITNVEELSIEEKATFQNYERILSKREVSIADMRQFMIFQINSIEMRWRDNKISQDEKAELIPYHTVYKTLLQAIDAPEAERVALEQVLLQQINSTAQL